MKLKYFYAFFIVAIVSLSCVKSEDDDATVESDADILADNESEEIEVAYGTPKPPPNAYFVETFDNIAVFEKTWIKSRAKKDDVDDDIAKYDGVWTIEPAEKDPLIGDLGLVLKSKAKHAAISAPLKKPFVFKDKKLFIVQYEVNLQNGQDCGGAYIKLLSSDGKSKMELKTFQDKFPYTIMFGPDKCGNDHKLHFIFRHVNPLNKNIEEKNAKRPDSKFEDPFKDKLPHLYTLIIKPDNSFQVLLDNEILNAGNLLEDFTPSVNPPKEIDDPNDTKPSDWDEREKIADPESKKPEDWDEDASKQIKDEFATKPTGWLEIEPELIPDPEAVKPEDWDVEMDGEWEAPLVSNPKCEGASGCGEWRAPMIDNPAYKGKWVAPMINNPNYKGKWSPRRIPNPDFFEDLEPFKMTTIGAVGLELWSMSDSIYFDNILITDSIDEARQFASETFDLKLQKLQKGQKGFFKQIIDYTNQNPWIYGVYVLIVAIPVVIIFVCCCAEDVKDDKKKTDEVTEDDPHEEEEEKEEEEEDDDDDEEEGEEEDEEEEAEEVQVEEKQVEEKQVEEKQVEEKQVEEKQVEEKQVEEEEASKSEHEEEVRTSPRLRKARKE